MPILRFLQALRAALTFFFAGLLQGGDEPRHLLAAQPAERAGHLIEHLLLRQLVEAVILQHADHRLDAPHQAIGFRLDLLLPFLLRRQVWRGLRRAWRGTGQQQPRQCQQHSTHHADRLCAKHGNVLGGNANPFVTPMVSRLVRPCLMRLIVFSPAA